MTIPDITTGTRPNPFNTDLATRTLAAIEADPAHWNQRTWVLETQCGTKWCFAGWAVRLHDGLDPQEPTAIQHRAVEVLGIDRLIADPLFAASNTLDDLRRIIADYAAAQDLRALEAAAFRWGAGEDEDEDEPDQDYWYDEDDL